MKYDEIIKGLECCIDSEYPKCFECPYVGIKFENGCDYQVKEDAVKFLKYVDLKNIRNNTIREFENNLVNYLKKLTSGIKKTPMYNNLFDIAKKVIKDVADEMESEI